MKTIIKFGTILLCLILGVGIAACNNGVQSVAAANQMPKSENNSLKGFKITPSVSLISPADLNNVDVHIPSFELQCLNCPNVINSSTVKIIPLNPGDASIFPVTVQSIRPNVFAITPKTMLNAKTNYVIEIFNSPNNTVNMGYHNNSKIFFAQFNFRTGVNTDNLAMVKFDNYAPDAKTVSNSCVGSIISPRVVLTAGHCMPIGESANTYFGSMIFFGGQFARVTPNDAYFNNFIDVYGKRADIALIHTQESMPVTPFKLPLQCSNDSYQDFQNLYLTVYKRFALDGQAYPLGEFMAISGFDPNWNVLGVKQSTYSPFLGGTYFRVPKLFSNATLISKGDSGGPWVDSDNTVYGVTSTPSQTAIVCQWSQEILDIAKHWDSGDLDYIPTAAAIINSSPKVSKTSLNYYTGNQPISIVLQFNLPMESASILANVRIKFKDLPNIFPVLITSVSADAKTFYLIPSGVSLTPATEFQLVVNTGAKSVYGKSLLKASTTNFVTLGASTNGALVKFSQNSPNGSVDFCMGSFISPHLILTNSSCVDPILNDQYWYGDLNVSYGPNFATIIHYIPDISYDIYTPIHTLAHPISASDPYYSDSSNLVIVAVDTPTTSKPFNLPEFCSDTQLNTESISLPFMSIVKFPDNNQAENFASLFATTGGFNPIFSLLPVLPYPEAESWQTQNWPILSGCNMSFCALKPQDLGGPWLDVNNNIIGVTADVIGNRASLVCPFVKVIREFITDWESGNFSEAPEDDYYN